MDATYDSRTKSLDQDADETFKKIKIEISKNVDFYTLDRLSRLIPKRQIIPWPYIHAEWHLS